MIEFPGDAKRGYPSTQSYGLQINSKSSVGGSERFDKIDANKITVYDIDASTASIKAASITTAKIGEAQITNALLDQASVNKIQIIDACIVNLSATKINAGVLTVGGNGNAVQFQAKNSSDGVIVTIANDGMIFANTGSPGIFFNSSGGTNPASIFCDGSSNLVLRAGNAETIYFQNRDGSDTTLILNTSGRVVQIGTNDDPATLYCVPRSAAPGSPSRGMIYYDSDDDKLYCHNGSGWQALF